jgi:outer membrane protein assembly factor BamB
MSSDAPTPHNGSAPSQEAARGWFARDTLFPPPLIRWIVVVCLAAIVSLRCSVDWVGHATSNVASLCLSLLALMTVILWFVLRSGYAARLRYATGMTVAVLVLVLVAAVRVEHVSGELMPRFRFRWQPHPDELLDRPTVHAAGAADLATTTPHDFPQFLGPERTAVVTGVKLARDWTTKPPRECWRIKIGAGWSGFAVVNGFAVTMEQRGPFELVTCYEVATGQSKWWHAIETRHATIAGGIGPRATPTIHAGRVYAQGATGVLRCLDGATGQEIWTEDLLKRTGSTAEEDLNAVAWGRAGSPLVVDDLVVVPLGGAPKGPWKSLAAYRRDTGEVAWTGGQRQAAYASPCLATLAGVRQILIVNQDFVSSHRPDTGEVLWEYPWPGKSNADASASQPVALPGDRVLLSKGYGVGARLLQLSCVAGEDWQVEPVWINRRVLNTKYTNVVVRGAYAYGLSDGTLECVEWPTGKSQWRKGRYGPGQILGVDDLLLVQAEEGNVVLVEATPEKHRELAVWPALSEKTWNTLCLYDHLLLVRNAEEAACFELP